MIASKSQYVCTSAQLFNRIRDTGINRGTITRLYNETATRVDLEVIDALCNYLNVSVGELFKFQREGTD
ncbi:helix-turn-helix domain-containing protein [Photobacterium sp. DNB23_23_1]